MLLSWIPDTPHLHCTGHKYRTTLNCICKAKCIYFIVEDRNNCDNYSSSKTELCEHEFIKNMITVVWFLISRIESFEQIIHTWFNDKSTKIGSSYFWILHTLTAYIKDQYLIIASLFQHSINGHIRVFILSQIFWIIEKQTEYIINR